MVAGRVGLACCALVALGAHARGVSPYLPLQQTPEIERAIERLLILADKPIMKRPIAAATVFDALPKACERDEALCDQVKRYLATYMRTAGITDASLAAGAGSGAATALPNRHGMDSDSGYELSSRVYWQIGDYFLLSGGVVAYEGDTTPTGTMLSIGHEYAQVDIGYRDHWLSPFTDSSMLLGTEAATMPSITVSNYTPLSRLNVSYEIVHGRDERVEQHRIRGRVHQRKPAHRRAADFDRAVSRLVDRREQNPAVRRRRTQRRARRPAGRILQSLGLRQHGHRQREFGNQVAALSSRFLFPGKVPFAVYFEYAGEDTSTLSNLRLGNTSVSAGIDFPMLTRNLSLTLEMSEWQNGWYVHGIYRDGLRNDGRVIGHWGGDWRTLGDGSRSAQLDGPCRLAPEVPRRTRGHLP